MKNILKLSSKMIKKNSPAIFSGLAITGVITTSYLAFKAQPKYEQLKKENKIEKDWYKLPSIKKTYKPFLPAFGSGLLTIACIIGAQHINTKRNIALAGLYMASEADFKKYKNKVSELLGKGKQEKVAAEVKQDEITFNPVDYGRVHDTTDGKELCFDRMSGRYFYSSIEALRRHLNEANHELNQGMYINLNDFYSYIGLPAIGLGELLGWNNDYLIKYDFDSTITTDEKPCLVLDFDIRPNPNYALPF